MVLVPHRPLLSLTAGELMSRTVVMVPREMSLHGAARLLTQAQVTGAPVVDDQGRCVGVLSATDFLHRAENGKSRRPAKGKNNVCSPWQILEAESSPEESVCEMMTPDPVTVPPTVSIVDLSRMMLDAHIHRVIVVDAMKHPVGIVSSTDILAAIAHVDHGKDGFGELEVN